MTVRIKAAVIFIASILLAACASEPLKAPCDQYGSFCGGKIKINQW